MIVGDWGTSNLRLYRLDPGEPAGAIMDRLDGPGVGQLSGTPADAFIATIAPWIERAREMPVLLCGMAGSRLGLIEVPYLGCPAPIASFAGSSGHTSVEGVAIRIVPGLACANFLGRADVLRGEETQIAGALTMLPSPDRERRLMVLPGTHSKWAEVHDGSIARFHTFPTGEMFALIERHSTLAGDPTDAAGIERGFAEGLSRAASAEPLGALFEARSAQLIGGRSGGWACGFASGLLIGAEVRQGLALADDCDAIHLVGAPQLCALYQQTFALIARRTPAVLDGDRCVIAGLVAILRGTLA